MLLLDTDLDQDCDDVGAIAVLHALADAGEVEIAGVVCSAPIAGCAPAAHALNRAFGRPEVPVGRFVVPDYAASEVWAAYRAHRRWLYRHETEGGYVDEILGDGPVEDATRLYRRVLAGAADGGVRILAIGTLTALAALLDSGPDDLSPLDGTELARRKVAELTSMALGDFPAGRDSFNWWMDRPAAARVIGGWPGLLTVSPAGDHVFTGARFVAAAPPDHPARRAYVRYLGGEGRVRPSWDQIAVLHAVLGERAPMAVSGPRGLAYSAENGLHHWAPFDGGPVRRLAIPLLPDSALAAMVEEWMIRAFARG